MYSDRTVGVVVPAYNEEDLIGRVVETMPSYVDRVYLVDDASTDGTWAELTDAVEAARACDDGEGTFDERWVPIQHAENQGVGGAILTGYRRALADDIDATAVMAGDSQMDPDVLPRLLDPVVEGEVEYAKASRLLRREDWTGMPPVRLVGNLVLTLLTQISSGYPEMTDPQNGYTVVSQRALRELDLDSLYEDYGFANDLLVKLNAAGMAVADVETSSEFVYGDEEWDSHIDLKTFVPKTSVLLLRNFLWRLKEERGTAAPRPFVLLYALAVGGVLVGLCLLLSTAAGLGSGDADGTRSAGIVAASVVSGVLALVRDRRVNTGLLTRIYTE